MLAAATLPPFVLFFLDVPAGVLASCASYGYGCTDDACFIVEISTDQGQSWTRDSASIYGVSYSEIDLYVRTTLSTTSGGVEGWSLGVEHSAPTLAPGAFVLSAAVVGPDVATVQAGAPPDFESTRTWTCGLTQGIVVDMDSTHHTIGPVSDLVTVEACYKVTMPGDSLVHTVTLAFTENVGVPPVSNIVTQNNASVVPCLQELTLSVQSTYYWSTPSYCPYTSVQPSSCDGGGGGGGGEGGGAGGGQCIVPVPTSMFVRGDSNSDGTVGMSDAVWTLNWLFLGGPGMSCAKTADSNDNGSIDLSDGVYLLNYLFVGGPEPPAPFSGCGVDLTADAFDCVSYAPCPGLTGANVSQALLTQVETAIAINPCDPDNIVVLSNHLAASGAQFGTGLFRAVSFDGGNTWPVHGPVFDRSRDTASVDPALAFDAFGNLYAAYAGRKLTLQVAVSIDGGITFPSHLNQEVFYPDVVSSSEQKLLAIDRPRIATGPSALGPGSASVWVTGLRTSAAGFTGIVAVAADVRGCVKITFTFALKFPGPSRRCLMHGGHGRRVLLEDSRKT